MNIDSFNDLFHDLIVLIFFGNFFLIKISRIVLKEKGQNSLNQSKN